MRRVNERQGDKGERRQCHPLRCCERGHRLSTSSRNLLRAGYGKFWLLTPRPGASDGHRFRPARPDLSSAIPRFRAGRWPTRTLTDHPRCRCLWPTTRAPWLRTRCTHHPLAGRRTIDSVPGRRPLGVRGRRSTNSAAAHGETGGRRSADWRSYALRRECAPTMAHSAPGAPSGLAMPPRIGLVRRFRRLALRQASTAATCVRLRS